MTIIYNKSNGKVILMMSETIEAVSSVVSDIPDGYIVSSVNTETGEPVFEPIPKTDEQKEIDSLKTAAYALASVSTTLTNEQALSMPEFFPEWESGTDYIKGQIVIWNDQLYHIEQDVTSLDSQSPDMEGMLAIYRPIMPEHEGTLEDPIPWVYGMDCYSGKYYSYNSKIYKCTGDMLPCVWEPGSAGVYQWEEIA